MYINTFKYKPEDVACVLCAEYVKKLGCTALSCPCLAERMEAGVVGYTEAVAELFPLHPYLTPRILRLVAGEGIEIGRGEVERFAEAGLLHRPFGIVERRKRKERRAQYESRERPQFDLGHRLKHKKQFGPVERCGIVRFMLHRQQPQTDARHA